MFAIFFKGDLYMLACKDVNPYVFEKPGYRRLGKIEKGHVVKILEKSNDRKWIKHTHGWSMQQFFTIYVTSKTIIVFCESFLKMSYLFYYVLELRIMP